MHGQGFFFQAFVYLAAAVVAVPIAKRLWAQYSAISSREWSLVHSAWG